MNNQDNQDQGLQTPGFSDMFDDWKQRTPAACRFCVHLGVISVVGSIFQLPLLTGNCVRYVFENFQVWRILLSHFVDNSFFQALFGGFWLYICASRVEKVKGSVFIFHSYMVCSLLNNILFTLLAGFLAYNPWAPTQTTGTYFNATTGDEIEYDNPFLCSYGAWATIFSLLVLETSLSNDEKRRFLCFPWMINTKYYPVVLLLLFEILSFRLDVLIGFAVGYLFSYVTWLQLSLSRNRNWENASWLTWLTTKDNFVGIDNGGTALPGVWSSPPQDGSAQSFTQAMPWGAGGASQSSQWGSGSGSSAPGGARVMGVGDVRGQGQQPQQMRGGASSGATESRSTSNRNVFSGQGHSLQSSTNSSAAVAAAPSSSHQGGTHPLAAAYAQQQREARLISPPPRDTQQTAAETIVDIPTEVLPAEPWPHALPEDTTEHKIQPKENNTKPPTVSESEIARLTELGYTRKDALPALEFSGGDITEAIKYLHGKADQL